VTLYGAPAASLAMRTWTQPFWLAGCLLISTIAPLRAQLVPDGATNTLSNVTTTITGDVTVGTNGSFTLLTLANNALLTNSANGVIGRNATAKSNEVRLVSPTARWLMGGDLSVGSNGANSRLVVSNGAYAENFVGSLATGVQSSNNFALVTGNGSVWSNRANVIVGWFGGNNQMLVTNGGRVVAAAGSTIGSQVSAGGNVATVTGPGSVWSSGGGLSVGNMGASNRLVIEAGGRVDCTSGIVAFGSGSNNVALVTGAGSVWSNVSLQIGGFGPNSQLIVSNGGTVTAGDLFVGFNSSSTGNRLTVDGGTLRVTNVFGNGTLDLRRGSCFFNSGVIEVDNLRVTNTASPFDFNGGTLSVKSSRVDVSLVFDVGDGVSPATLFLLDNGLHHFTGPGILGSPHVQIRSSATVTGNGTIGGRMGFFTGSRLMPGIPQGGIGTIAFSNSPGLQGTVVMEISRNGATLTNDQVQVMESLTYGGSLVVSNFGPDALAAGNSFKLFSAPAYSNAFANLDLPPLNAGLSWSNKLLLDGSLEVLGLIVQTLPASALASDTATLNGVVNPGGQNATAWFEWGTTTSYGNVTPPQALGNGVNPTHFSQVLPGLAGGVTYHFRAVASNSFGVVFGGDQSFTTPAFGDIGAGLPGVYHSSLAWGDYDNDGRLDILVNGIFTGDLIISLVLRNTGSGFTTNLNAALPPVYDSSVAWGDYDNDGLLDFVFTGDNVFNLLSQVWRNTGSGFTNINAGLPGVRRSSVAWGDYDNDGRLDFLLTGTTNGLQNGVISQVWRNTGSGFSDSRAELPGVFLGSVAWGDYDNDGRLDILLTGRTSGGGEISQVWRNTGSGFTNINAGLPGVAGSSVAWGDYDNDGRLDILLTGNTSAGGVSQVWRNTGSGFTNINAGLPGVVLSSVAWGDYDNDGRLDILLTGDAGIPISQVWRNTGSGFTNVNAGLPGVSSGTAAWGDYDSDGRLDILITGTTNGDVSGAIFQVWRNNTPNTNAPPTAPSGLNVTLAGITPTFTWGMAADSQTPASGLSYNLRVGTTPGGSEIVASMAATTGLRRLPQLGNVQTGSFRTLTLPAGQHYYWSVQAVDTAFAGSPFAVEKSFTFQSVFTPPNGIPVPGDTDGDGIVSQPELAAVLTNLNGNGIVTESDLDLILTNYFAYSPFLQMTNVAGLGGTNVTFALTNDFAGAFSVEYTTNLLDWLFLGPATPRYLFTDTNAPAQPQRYYRLRWP